jgi:hypothetical protein
MTIKPIQTTYRGHRFRSRLEARWAMFFHRAGVDWHYETQGFMVGGRPYLPDFYLPATGTWVEVKGAEAELDHDLMEAAPTCLPGEGSPQFLILGPMPEAPEGGNWAWLGFSAETFDGEQIVLDGWWQFGDGGLLEHAAETSCAPPFSAGGDEWLSPALNMAGEVPPRFIDAYRAARSARFEHGESGGA